MIDLSRVRRLEEPTFGQGVIFLSRALDGLLRENRESVNRLLGAGIRIISLNLVMNLTTFGGS